AGCRRARSSWSILVPWACRVARWRRPQPRSGSDRAPYGAGVLHPGPPPDTDAMSWLMIGVSAGAAVVAMIVGGLILGTTQSAGQIWRGVLIGLNSGLNFLLGWWLLQGLSYGVAVAGGLALIGYLSVVP